MPNQAQHAEHKDKPASQRGPAKPVRQGPVAPQPAGLALQRALADPAGASPSDILALQRAAGNRAVTRLIQAKLTVGPTGDKYEQEADRVADQVVSGQRSAFSGQPPAVSNQMSLREASLSAVSRQAEDEEEVQTKSDLPSVEQSPENVIRRDVFSSYEAAANVTYTNPHSGRNAYEAAKGQHETTHGPDTAEAKVKGEVEPIINPVLPMITQIPATYTWEQVIDRLFENTLANAEANWTYNAGGSGTAPIVFAGTGHCGNFAAGFVTLVNALADFAGKSDLKAKTGSKGQPYFTPPIQNVVNVHVGPDNAFAGRNHSVGNIGAMINNETDSRAINYAAVNRAKFPAHTWAVVDIPGKGKKLYDVLAKYKKDGEDYPGLTDVTGSGYAFVRAPDPAPEGFVAGVYMIAEALWTKINELRNLITKNQLENEDLSNDAVTKMLSWITYRPGYYLGRMIGVGPEFRAKVKAIIDIKRSTTLDFAIEILRPESPRAASQLQRIHDLTVTPERLAEVEKWL
jgi:hypothetical protein